MLTDEAAELLIDHQINTLNRSHVECLCGWYLEPTPKVEYAGLLAERFYREHLAELIAARVRAARAQELRDTARIIPGPVESPQAQWLRDRAETIENGLG